MTTSAASFARRTSRQIEGLKLATGSWNNSSFGSKRPHFSARYVSFRQLRTCAASAVGAMGQIRTHAAQQTLVAGAAGPFVLPRQPDTKIDYVCCGDEVRDKEPSTEGDPL
jgi:hypothetical protein